MQHAIIDAMQCMRAIKDRIARPVYQLENHLNQPLYPHGVSTGEIIGTTHLSASHNVAINQVINQSEDQAQDVCMNAKKFISDFYMHSLRKTAHTINQACFTLRTEHGNPQMAQFQISSGFLNHGRTLPGTEICTRYLKSQLNLNLYIQTPTARTLLKFHTPTQVLTTRTELKTEKKLLPKSSRKLKSYRVSLLPKGSSSTAETLFSTPTNPTSSWYQSREFLHENPAPPISLKKET
ncbi:hypothetical protein F511_03979 [Dorcoceras hygrometricum]|uniref:Uncharacterized protein n=1 Tax=Dorcoceras hygrometricum TaxID=472368 RepID=A0A2Z7D7K5_9LAMI|nr:hypothetical protein F511_03979 [Dorcoceras hygrometricum]